MSESNRIQVSRSDDDPLRTRIAAVLPKIFERIADGELVEWGDMADAVIRELPELCARRRCERCRKTCHPDEFPLMHDGSDELRRFCIPCTNYIEWTTS